MRIIPRLIIILSLVWLFIVLFLHAKKLWGLEPDDAGYNPYGVVIYSLLLIVVALAIGATVSLLLLPALGERVGHFFFMPNQEIEKPAHADALAFYNQGDYEGAVAAYRNVVHKNPDDTHAISEAVRILCENLKRPEDAAAYLNEVLEREDWEPETRAFLSARLVDIYWDFMQDSEHALAILNQVVADMPNTTSAANANHRIRKIEEAVFLQRQAQTTLRPKESEDAESADIAASESTNEDIITEEQI